MRAAGATSSKGVHDGYLPLVHRRRLVALAGAPGGRRLGPGDGDGHHLAEVHWHVDGAWRARREAAGHVVLAARARARRVDSPRAAPRSSCSRGDDARARAGIPGLRPARPSHDRSCSRPPGRSRCVVVTVFAERGDARRDGRPRASGDGSAGERRTTASLSGCGVGGPRSRRCSSTSRRTGAALRPSPTGTLTDRRAVRLWLTVRMRGMAAAALARRSRAAWPVEEDLCAGLRDSSG